MNDVYYNPEKSGLRIVDELNEDGLSYEYNMLVVWQHNDGRLFYASDSGCSCPSPFESYTDLASLIPVNKESWSMFRADVESFPVSMSERSALLNKVRHLLEGR